ncbi:MAG: hypothetical protein DMF49_00325 [Acidobacteria bacterium]|nr:MAG: hypothetical protein DMF49_00325 [Acidobacteriota bacterium]
MAARTRALVAGLILLPAAVFFLYLFLALHWSYSDGERAGILQKFSRKGWICKTYEGELAMTTVPGVAPTLWSFSVRDQTVARQIESVVGKRVVLHYTEHRGLPTSCFGETGTFVDSVRLQD